MPIRRISSLLGLSFALASSASTADRARERAMTAWQARCKSAGEFIHKTAADVDGIVVLKERFGNNLDYQFVMDDPYGRDHAGDDYLRGFLRGFHPGGGHPARIGYRFVEAGDPAHGRAFRYTGRHEEPWQTDKTFLQGHIRFVMDRVPIPAYTARYGVTWDDISTREDRELWIAGSSLKVIDLQTGALMAERVGYMVDPGQGVTGGEGGSPWVRAADHACPDFRRHEPKGVELGRGMSYQPGQTLDFVQKVLRPAQ